MKRLIKRFFLIFIISLLSITKANCTNIDDLDISYLKEISNSVKESIYKDIPQEYFKKTDITNIAKQAIYSYYNKTTFEEPEWIRVKNFLTWLERNKESLNADFTDYLSYFKSFGYFTRFSYVDKQVFIGSFLGANYLTRNVTGKKFELQILLKNRCRIYEKGGICIYATNIITAINSAIHEATHILPVNNKSFIGKEISKSDILSEQATIFAQLKYGLPLKINDENILSGARANFRIANKEFVYRYIDPLLREYGEIVPAITEYSKYSNKISDILNLHYTTDMSVRKILSKLLYYKALSEYVKNIELTDIESRLAINPVYKETIAEIYDNIYAANIDKLENKSAETIDFLSFELFESNTGQIALTFYKNLKKYADPNIPPLPKGYI